MTFNDPLYHSYSYKGESSCCIPKYNIKGPHIVIIKVTASEYDRSSSETAGYCQAEINYLLRKYELRFKVSFFLKIIIYIFFYSLWSLIQLFVFNPFSILLHRAYLLLIGYCSILSDLSRGV